MAPRGCSPRIAIYTHDNYGIGHVQRSLHIMQALADQDPSAAILFITATPMLELLKRLPPNADYVKIPTLGKPSDVPQPYQLPIGQADVALMRERLIQETLSAFAPDVLMVDNFALGAQRELLPALHEARRLGVRTILGLRDVIDIPRKVRNDWRRRGIYEVLDRYYDRIVVYGIPEVLDTASTYDLPVGVAERIHYCGYVTGVGPPPRSPDEVRAQLGIEGPFVVAAVGGGGDGFPLLETFLRAQPLLAGVSSVIITGALMNAIDRSELRALAAGCRDVVSLDFVPDLPSYMAAADAVVTMCGYNTAVEIMAVGCNAIVVPRTWRSGEHLNRADVSAESEQLLRAQALAKLGMVDLLEPRHLTPERLAERIDAALARPKAGPREFVDLQGARRAAGHTLALAREGRRNGRV